jgi:hypothetical protein
MTSSGRLWAFVIAVLIAFALPKRVECGYPGGECTHYVGKVQCTPYEVEPLVFSWLEHAFSRDIGFAYSSSEGCR